jgi:hypothetical protein
MRCCDDILAGDGESQGGDCPVGDLSAFVVTAVFFALAFGMIWWFDRV